MGDDQLEHVLTALDTYRQVMSSPGAGESWKRSAKMNLDRELANYQTTAEAQTIEGLRTLLREVDGHLPGAAVDPELKQRVREALGEELEQPK